jgi:hypothetical protein
VVFPPGNTRSERPDTGGLAPAPITSRAWTLTQLVGSALRQAIMPLSLSGLLRWLGHNLEQVGEKPRRRRPAQIVALLSQIHEPLPP